MAFQIPKEITPTELGWILFILLLLMSSMIIVIFRMHWPVRQLTYVDPQVLTEFTSNNSIKLLDVRDAVDFEQCHVDGSINISIGRLPFVWEKELSSEDEVLIMAGSRYKSKKAARILRNRGFHQLYAVSEPCERCKPCCA